jgi:hypothetical protein
MGRQSQKLTHWSALLTVEGMEEANGWRVVKAWEPHAFAYPPVIRLAEVGPFRAAPEFLLRRQVSDDIAAGPRGGVIARV